MKPGGSLRLRLLVGTLAWTLLATAVAGWGLRTLFQQHIHEQLQGQMLAQLDLLSAAVDWDGSTQRLVLGDMAADPRLNQPLSGLYWQVDRLGEHPRPAALRSRSLWDQVLPLPPAPAAGATAAEPDPNPLALQLRDTDGHQLLAITRTLQLAEDEAPALRLSVAANQALIAEPMARFTRLLLIALAVLATGLALAVMLQLQLAVQPLRRMREGLTAVRQGRSAQLDGVFPQELQPLVNEFNHVLRENADIVQRARTQAGNLAHAVHTPLAILANAAAQEQGPLARLVTEQVASAQRQVDWNLSQARAAAAVRATGLRTPVLEAARALLRTMEHLHAERGLRFELDAQAQDLHFRGEAQDLYELLGNLLDNAGKWARSQVRVNVQAGPPPSDSAAPPLLCITVDDDGPGIPAEQRQRMFERGVRIDEQHPGTGLGLDIVRSLAHTYGGQVQALDAPLGGARIQLMLPLAP